MANDVANAQKGRQKSDRNPRGKGTRHSHGKNHRPQKKRSSLSLEKEEIERLDERIQAGAPARGSNPLAADLVNGDPTVEAGNGNGRQSGGKGSGGAATHEGDELKPYVGVKLFEELPISEKTKTGLQESGYTHMTAIQRSAIPHALAGRDVLGAAKTGSGKTLAFLVPIIERLFRQRWSSMDGVGAIIISPTRELATQIFSELQKVGRHHGLSGGLLIGGRAGSVEAEKERAGSLNICCCTPGRLLQHMDETPSFDCTNLQVLVLDEADRILDMGFASTLDAILQNFPPPPHRQTLLFSATQTRSVKDLARLSLSHPEYVAVHEKATVATPLKLQQTVMTVEAGAKLDVLWSFLKTHLKGKILVFLSSCKQVKFAFESFCRLRPGMPLKMLHGRMKQMTRLAVFYDFCESQSAALFATDIAARGLDFPAVDWVVQVDCPDDVATYIHRVGRTARFNASGHSLLLLLPSERAMLPALEAAKIPVKVTKANPARMQSISASLASLLSHDPHLKHLAQRSLVTYLRSVYLQGNKEVFDVTKLPVEDLAASMGLPNPPKIRFLKKVHDRKNRPYASQADARQGEPGSSGSEGEEGEEDEEGESDSEGEGGGGERGRKREKAIERGRVAKSEKAGREGKSEGKKKDAAILRSAEWKGSKVTFGEEGSGGEEGEGGGRSLSELWKDEGESEDERGYGNDGRGSDDDEPEWSSGEGVEVDGEEEEEEVEEHEGGEEESGVGKQRARPPFQTRGRELQVGATEEGDSDVDGVGGKKKSKEEGRRRSKIERLFGRKNRDVLSSAYEKLRDQSSHGGDEEDLDLELRRKRADSDDGDGGGGGVEGSSGGAKKRQAEGKSNLFDSDDEEEGGGSEAKANRKGEMKSDAGGGAAGAIPERPLSRKQRKKLLAGPGKHGGTRVVFDDEGNALPPLAALAMKESDVPAIFDAAEARFERLRQEMKERDKLDRQAEKERLRAKRMKQKEKGKRREEGQAATLARDDDADDGEGWNPHDSSSDEGEEEGGQELEEKRAFDHQGSKRQRTGDDVESMGLEDQEKLVLSLLASRR